MDTNKVQLDYDHFSILPREGVCVCAFVISAISRMMVVAVNSVSRFCLKCCCDNYIYIDYRYRLTLLFLLLPFMCSMQSLRSGVVAPAEQFVASRASLSLCRICFRSFWCHSRVVDENLPVAARVLLVDICEFGVHDIRRAVLRELE